jgi:hypothetical protein
MRTSSGGNRYAVQSVRALTPAALGMTGFNPFEKHKK